MLGTKQEVSQDVALDTWDCFPSFHSCALVPSWVPGWHFSRDTAGSWEKGMLLFMGSSSICLFLSFCGISCLLHSRARGGADPTLNRLFS